MNTANSNTIEIKKEEIFQVLLKFQEGYEKREIEEVESFMEELFVKDNDLLVIGTSAIDLDSEEWCKGYDQVKKLIEDDWKYWGHLKLNIDKARISVQNESACISVQGIVTERIKKENYYDFRLELVKKTLAKDKINSKAKLMEIMQGASDTLYEAEKGEKYNWPVRLSGMLVNREGKWLINHLHFSYPITFYPPVRYLNNKQ